MLVRISFKKYGNMKFIGHLDVMRYFQKAFRRAKLDLKYTQGYNPHIILSFASPLGVGITSDKEYLDLGLNSSEEPSIMIDKINNVLTEGFLITDFKILKDVTDDTKIVPAMSLVTDADYLVSLKDGYTIANNINSQDEFIKVFKDFYKQEEIMINKKTKKSEVILDIKPFIRFIDFSYDSYVESLTNNGVTTAVESEKTSVVKKYNNNIKVYMELSAGSVNNIKPELVLEAFYNYIGGEFNPYAFQIHRFNIYTRDENSGKIIPIGDI